MATGTLYIQTRNESRPRCIKTSDASALTVLHGITTTTVNLYKNAAASGTWPASQSGFCVATTVQNVEYAPGNLSGGKTTISSSVTDWYPSLEIPTDSGSKLGIESITLPTVLSCTVYKYLKLTGTGLPTNGVIIPLTDVVDMFTETPNDL
jgi:hypothetical protein